MGGFRIHIPVMTEEVLFYLDPKPDGIYVDGTLGDGGHAREICSRLTGKGKLIGIDRDWESLERAEKRLKEYEGRYILVKENFAHIETAVAKAGFESVDGVLLDLGISSNQVDQSGRGFSYRQDGPLDMRMDQSKEMSAADILAKYSKEDLARIFRDFGEEKWALRIADFVVKYRETEKINYTSQLVSIIQAAVPVKARQKGKHPARRCFQALRIAVNGELEALRVVLPASLELLNSGGVMCIISYHSLEDRMVKRFMRDAAESCSCPPGFPQCSCGRQAVLELLSRRAVKPSDEEISGNPRARSASLRVGKKIKKEESAGDLY